MLRAAAATSKKMQSSLLHHSQKSLTKTITTKAVVVRPSSSTYPLLLLNNTSFFTTPKTNSLRPLVIRGVHNKRVVSVRYLSSESNNNDGKKGGGAEGSEEPMSQEIVKTPGEKVVEGTRTVFWLGVLGLASVCGYFIVKELLPSKMSPNTVFNKAFEVVRENSDVQRKFGPSLKAYGRGGGRNEGRRNFIEHTEYTSQDDGSKRTRVRFNVEGEFGKSAFVFAEVSSDMPSGEFVYILLQDKQTGRVTTIVDNRAALQIKQMAGGNDKASQVFGNLLGGGGGDKK